MSYEDLLIEAEKLGINVFEINMESGATGFCIENIIGIEKNMTETEKRCILAEELGHYYTTAGNIIDQNIVCNRKQELFARKCAIDKLISLDDLYNAYKACCNSLYEVAEYLNVTVEFLNEALQAFKRRCLWYFKDEYVIIFNDVGYSIIKR